MRRPIPASKSGLLFRAPLLKRLTTAGCLKASDAASPTSSDDDHSPTERDVVLRFYVCTLQRSCGEGSHYVWW